MPRTTRSVTYAAALLLALPLVARAQTPVRHGADGPWGGKSAPVAPVNLARLIVDNPRDMALSDSQRKQLVLIQRQLDSANAPLLARLDSLRPTWRPAGGLNDLSQEQRDQLVAQREGQIAVIDQLTPAFDQARQHVMALLRPDQQDRAKKLEKEARKTAERAAQRGFEPQQERYDGRGRRGEIRDATGHSPIG